MFKNLRNQNKSSEQQEDGQGSQDLSFRTKFEKKM